MVSIKNSTYLLCEAALKKRRKKHTHTPHTVRTATVYYVHSPNAVYCPRPMISIFRHRFLKASLLTTKPNPCLPLPPHHDEPATLRKRCSTPKKKTHLLVSVWPSTIVVQNAQLLYTTTVFQQQTHTGTDFSQHHINNKYNMVVVRSCSSVYMSLRCRNCIWTHRTCWQ